MDIKPEQSAQVSSQLSEQPDITSHVVLDVSFGVEENVGTTSSDAQTSPPGLE